MATHAGCAHAFEAGFHGAHIVATIAGGCIAVVAGFGIRRNAIAAAGWGAIGIAAVAIGEIAVFAKLVHGLDPIAATRNGAIGIATIIVDGIAVVAGFGSAGDHVAASRNGAIGIAAVAFGHVAIVASFAIRGNTIAASSHGAIGIAAITFVAVSIVARFRHRHDAITAAGNGAIGVAAVAVGHIAVVAIFRASYDTIGAPGHLAIGIAAVAVDHIAVVAFFIDGRDAITARRRRAVVVAAVAVHHVPIIALLGTFLGAIAANGRGTPDHGDVVNCQARHVDRAIAIQVKHELDVFPSECTDIRPVHTPSGALVQCGVASAHLNLRLHRIVQELPDSLRVCPANLAYLEPRAIVRRVFQLVFHGPGQRNGGFHVGQIDGRRNQILAGAVVVGAREIRLPALHAAVAVRYGRRSGHTPLPFVRRTIRRKTPVVHLEVRGKLREGRGHAARHHVARRLANANAPAGQRPAIVVRIIIDDERPGAASIFPVKPMQAIIVFGLHDETRQGNGRRTHWKCAFIVERHIHGDGPCTPNVREQRIGISCRRNQVYVQIIGLLVIELNRHVEIGNARIARNRNRRRSRLGILRTDHFRNVGTRVRRAIRRRLGSRMHTHAQQIRARSARRTHANFIHSCRLHRGHQRFGIRRSRKIAIIDDERGLRCRRKCELSVPFRRVAFRIEVQARENRIACVQHQRKTIDVGGTRSRARNISTHGQHLSCSVIGFHFSRRHARLHLHVQVIGPDLRGGIRVRDAQEMVSCLRERRAGNARSPGREYSIVRVHFHGGQAIDTDHRKHRCIRSCRESRHRGRKNTIAHIRRDPVEIDVARCINIGAHDFVIGDYGGLHGPVVGFDFLVEILRERGERIANFFGRFRTTTCKQWCHPQGTQRQKAADSSHIARLPERIGIV